MVSSPTCVLRKDFHKIQRSRPRCVQCFGWVGDTDADQVAGCFSAAISSASPIRLLGGIIDRGTCASCMSPKCNAPSGFKPEENERGVAKRYRVRFSNRMRFERVRAIVSQPAHRARRRFFSRRVCGFDCAHYRRSQCQTRFGSTRRSSE